MREDIEKKPYAEQLGFTAEINHKGEWKPGVPYDPYSFVKGNVHVWAVRDGWRIARIIDNKFTDHITRPDLVTALNTAETEWWKNGN